MTLADKLYEILDHSYYNFCRTEGAPKGYYFGKLGNENRMSVELILKWHQMLTSNGMMTSEEFMCQRGFVCVKNPAIIHNEWIIISEDLALKIATLGCLPCI